MKDPPSVGGQYQCRCKDCDRIPRQSELVCGKITQIYLIIWESLKQIIYNLKWRLLLNNIYSFETGDDGVDYASNCHLQSTSCRLEKTILKAHNGPCNKGKYYNNKHFKCCFG